MIRTGVSVLGWGLLVPGTLAASALLILRVFTSLHTWHPVVIAAASVIPLLWIPVLISCLGLILVLRARWRLLGAALLVASTALFAWPLLPRTAVSDTPVAVDSTLTVLSLNLQYGRADVEEIAQLITPDVDALAFQEYTPSFEQELTAAGLLEEFPHQVGTSETSASGSMVLSRTPVELAARAESTRFENLIATTTIDGELWHIGVIHSAPPQMGADAWTEDAAAIDRLAEPFHEENLLLVGDFNAIAQHHTMRELTADSALDDLARPSAGTGGPQWHPTWPTGTWIPPFARIDHALVGAGVLGGAPQYETVDGSDHTALIVEVASPR
ncbi:endonuclease/exonuclease/phosphatase family protein [Brachybacterium fresconis]|uniref:Endonuclease/exonuclease/phosphatase (EEP) superfamily protein YafD n=1 Tax=Brachybacterium fresconis TaxID=173363 RepID=A0ABS4YRC6_9MICO|nr:endonuclease/exonuclease/phosphatase family protein [Brachybacterium fresconis]MBP2410952.1 endonuclease/exonuclease/phosphatase (EEP) superfamily protein YafD [Brachybacterium fresconis]